MDASGSEPYHRKLVVQRYQGNEAEHWQVDTLPVCACQRVNHVNHVKLTQNNKVNDFTERQVDRLT